MSLSTCYENSVFMSVPEISVLFEFFLASCLSVFAKTSSNCSKPGPPYRPHILTSSMNVSQSSTLIDFPICFLPTTPQPPASSVLGCCEICTGVSLWAPPLVTVNLGPRCAAGTYVALSPLPLVPMFSGNRGSPGFHNANGCLEEDYIQSPAQPVWTCSSNGAKPAWPGGGRPLIEGVMVVESHMVLNSLRDIMWEKNKLLSYLKF